MAQESESYLRFSLEESVWFQKGQEVAELYSIALDPNVTIQESDQYVYIRGSLDLSGEYKDLEDSEHDMHTQAYLPKSVQRVERHPDGLNEFTHCFPVDITIPNNRITSLEEIDITIQSFDYTLPERNCLNLQAELLITGIYNNDSHVEERPAMEQEHEEPEYLEESDDDKTEAPISYTAAKPSIPDFQPVFRNDEEDGLYTPFTAESKRVPNQQEEEEDPIYLSGKKQAPVFDMPVSPFPEEMKGELEEARQPVLDVEDIKKEREKRVENQVKRRVEEIEAEKERESEEVHPIENQVKRRVAEIEAEKGDVEAQVRKRVLDIERENEIIDQVKRRVEEIDEKKGKEIEAEVRKRVVEIEEEKEGTVTLTGQEGQPVVKLHKDEGLDDSGPERTGPIFNEQAMASQEDASSSLSGLFKDKEKSSAQKEVKNYKGRKQQQAGQEETGKEEEAGRQPSIMDLFGRKQEDELVRMKVCIVQQGETLEDVAQRYEVSVQSLLLNNELEGSQAVHEGQVLYIPKAMAYKN